MPMTKLELLAAEKADILFFNNHWEVEERWTVQITRKVGDTKLEIKGKGPDLFAAAAAALDAYERIVGKGIEEFRGPLLEAPRSATEIQRSDDIPF